MGVLVEGWVPVGVFDDINLKLEFNSSTAVRLFHVDITAPAYVPVYRVDKPSEVRMAKIPTNGLPIAMNVVGPGGLDKGPAAENTGYDVYVMVANDLSICAAMACVHGDPLATPAGWGDVYCSRAIRYFCCNVSDGGQPAVNNGILPFVEVATRKTFYCGEAENQQILLNDNNTALMAITLATSVATSKAQFPATARKVWVKVLASNIDADPDATLSLFLDGGTTAIFSLPNLSSAAGSCASKNALVEVPCNGNMDTTALMQAWSSGASEPDAPLVTVVALGYQL
jgi:hypothetical protein